MTYIEDLKSLTNPEKALELAKHHKLEREYLGASNAEIDALCKKWRAESSLETRVKIAATLWDSNIFEARLAAAKLLTQARINPDDVVWAEFQRWVPQFDSAVIADQACLVGARRLSADPKRLDTVEEWTKDESKWVRRAALTMTLPWTKQNHPTDAEMAARQRILGWMATYVDDHQWLIQKAIGGWLNNLSRHDPASVQVFIEEYGERLKPYAQREAVRNIG